MGFQGPGPGIDVCPARFEGVDAVVGAECQPVRQIMAVVAHGVRAFEAQQPGRDQRPQPIIADEVTRRVDSVDVCAGRRLPPGVTNQHDNAHYHVVSVTELKIVSGVLLSSPAAVEQFPPQVISGLGKSRCM